MVSLFIVNWMKMKQFYDVENCDMKLFINTVIVSLPYFGVSSHFVSTVVYT